MNKKILLMFCMFLLTLPLVSAVITAPYVDYDGTVCYYDDFSDSGNWDNSGNCAVSGGKLVCTSSLTGNNWVHNIHEHISADKNSINYSVEFTMTGLDCADGTYSKILQMWNKNSTDYATDVNYVQGAFAQYGPDNTRRLEDTQGGTRSSALGIAEGTAFYHIQVVIKTNGYGYIYVNGTLAGSEPLDAGAPNYNNQAFWNFGHIETNGDICGFVVDDWYSYNGSIKPASCGVPPPPPPSSIEVNINYPTNNAKLNNESYPLEITGLVNISDETAVNSTWINDTNWVNVGTNKDFNFTMNGTLIEGLVYYVTVYGNSSNGSLASSTVYFTYDATSPSSVSNLEQNNSYFLGYNNITFQINISDNIQLYSFNVTTSEGFVYSLTGLNTLMYIYNGSINVSSYSIGEHNITASYCDAHTKNKIEVWNNKVDKAKKEIRFNFGDSYFAIIPEDKTLLSDVSIEKLKDRYTFHYKKDKEKKSNKLSFYVISNEKIDIIGNEKGYYGWLVIYKLKKWIDFNTIFGSQLDYTITRVNDNMVIIDIDNLVSDEFTFNSAGDLNCNQKTWKYYLYNYTSVYDSRVTGLDDGILKLTIDMADFYLNGSATLFYNSTSYIPSFTRSLTQINYTVNVTYPFNFDSINTTIDFYWNYTLNGTLTTTQTYTQSVDSIRLSLWGNLSNSSAYNFTLYDEETNTITYGNIYGTFNYEPDLSFYPSLTNVTKMAITIYPSDAETTGNFQVYYSSPDAPSRSYSENNALYNDKTTTIKLYLLSAESGIYVRFRIVDGYNNPISTVQSSMARIIDGISTVVEQELSDDSGMAIFWADPDVTYTFTFVKEGYETFTADIRPTNEETYTITLSSEGQEVNESFSSEIKYNFLPTDLVLINNTEYNFAFNLTSTYWDITGCTLYLKNTSQILKQSSSSYTATSCQITFPYNTTGQTTLILEAKYQLAGTNNITVSQSYQIFNQYVGQFSLMNFLDDLKNFGDSGFKDSTRMLIAFIVMFIIIGSISIKFSQLREPTPLIILFLILLLLFSYLGWMVIDSPTIPYKVRGLADGWLNQYLMFILCLIIGVTYIIKENL